MSPVKKRAIRPQRSTIKSTRTTVRRTTSRPSASAKKKPVVVPLNAAAARTIAAKVDLHSAKTIDNSIKRLKISKGQFAPVINAFYKQSPANAEKFSKAAIKRWKKSPNSRAEAREMIQWADKAGVNQRRMMCKTFNTSGAGMIMVHGIGELKKTQARRYMKDYFKSGGDLKTVVQYLQIAGEKLRKNKPKDPDTDGGVIDAVGGFFEDVADAVVDAVTTVVDAVVSAGKSLGQVISEIVNWTASKIADVVDALLDAGKSVAALLAEAARKGLSALKKFARAVLDAGRGIGEILKWLAAKTVSTIKEVLNVILRAGRTVFQIMRQAVRYSFAVLKKMVVAMLQMGKSVLDMLKGAAAVAYSALRNTINAILQAGRTVASILTSALSLTARVMSDVLKAFLSLGKSITNILHAIARKTIEAVQKITDALLKLGKSLAAIMTAAMQTGVSMVGKIAQVLINLRKAVGDVLMTVASKAVSYMKAVVQGIMAAGRKVANIMAYAVRLTASALKKVVMGIYQATRKAVDVLVAVAGRAISAIRTVLEGLFAVGVQLAKAIKVICTDIGEAFRKGFFQGLVEIFKSPLKILKAALKAGGAILGLAFSAFLELWGGYRGLTATEKKEARRVFGASIDLNRIKVTNASIPSDVVNYLNGERPFTTMYVINFASWVKVDMKTLIHEMTHVWQGVTAGPVYMAEALHAQIFGQGYTVTDAALKANGGDLSKFNREQQASIVEAYWYNRWGGGGGDYSKYEPYARDVYKAPRSSGVRVNPRIPVARIIPDLSAVRIRRIRTP